MLWRKLVRDMWENKGSYAACLLIALIGLTVFIAFSIVTDNLSLSRDTFYRDQHFAAGFVELVAMPETAVDRLAAIEGIARINGRTVREVRVHDPQQEESIYLRLVSLDPERQRVNDARLINGRKLTAGNLDIWVDNQFLAANDLTIGDTVEVIVAGRVRRVQIAGVGMSPEFTFNLRSVADLFPRPEQFGIAFLSREDMAFLFPDMAGHVNEIVFTLKEDATYEQVRRLLEPEIERYGLLNMYPRDKHISHLMLTQEIEGLQAAAKGFPILFLSIAGVITFIMLKRLVEQQRGQIGILKALGYTNREITLHYLSYALFMGTGAGVVGGLLGLMAVTPLMNILLDFFNIPLVYGGFSWLYLGQGLLLSLVFFLIAGYQGTRAALRLKPAEAMRPPTPVSAKVSILEKSKFFTGLLTMQGKMGLRNLTRERGRSAFVFLGVMLSCALVAVTWSLNDVVDKLVFYQYEEVETYDVRLTLTKAVKAAPVLRELTGRPDVQLVEPLARVPATITHQWRAEKVAIIGVAPRSSLYNVLNTKGERVHLPQEGLVLSERLAKKLAVAEGSFVAIHSPYARDKREEVVVKVVEIIPQYMGMNGYMRLSYLQKVLNQGELITTALINMKSEGGIAAFKDRYRDSSLVAGIDSKEELVRKSREMMATFGSLIYVYTLMGAVISFAIIYNSSFVVLSERSWELASMRVLGMTPGEVFSVITFEQWFLSLFALLAGIPLARVLQAAMGTGLSTDVYTIPGALSPGAPWAAIALTTLSIWIAQRFALMRVGRLSLIEVLKSRE
jgi:putative ABC transport system permease protein